MARVADLLGLMPAQVRAAVVYYADFTDESDGELRRRIDLADQHEAAWRRQQAAAAR